MAFTLSLNTNPLVNRFADPDDLIDAIAYDIGIRDVQLTHEFVNPGWPAATISKFVRLFRTALDRTTTGAPTLARRRLSATRSDTAQIVAIRLNVTRRERAERARRGPRRRVARRRVDEAHVAQAA